MALGRLTMQPGDLSNNVKLQEAIAKYQTLYDHGMIFEIEQTFGQSIKLIKKKPGLRFRSGRGHDRGKKIILINNINLFLYIHSIIS
jgi:hypothetical protein